MTLIESHDPVCCLIVTVADHSSTQHPLSRLQRWHPNPATCFTNLMAFGHAGSYVTHETKHFIYFYLGATPTEWSAAAPECGGAAVSMCTRPATALIVLQPSSYHYAAHVSGMQESTITDIV